MSEKQALVFGKVFIINALQKALKQCFVENEELLSAEELAELDIRVEYPERKFGDYSSPVAMGLAKPLRRAPRQIAESLKKALMEQGQFEAVDIAGPGFINFKTSEDYLAHFLRQVAQSETIAKSHSPKNKKVLLEYVSANPTGPLHIGHGRWAVIGDIMARILRHRGFEVNTEFYVNDAGNQINNLYRSVEAVRKGEAIPEDGYHGPSISSFKDNEDDPVEYFLNQQKELLKNLGSEFDRFFRESELHQSDKVETMLAFLKKSEHVFEEDGALWFRTTDFGDDKDRVLVKSDGAKTYFAVDIAYHYEKIQRNYDQLINVFGADHHGYQARLRAAIEVLSEKKTSIHFIIGQLVKLYRDGEPVRMSKRTGEMISLEEVHEETGTDALRYFLSMRSFDSPIDFDIELAKKQENENPVFYIQYAYARIHSVLEKAELEGMTSSSHEGFDLGSILDESSRAIICHMEHFADELEQMSQSLEIHHLNSFLFELAGLFHKWYASSKFVDSADKTRSAHYLYLIQAVARVFEEGFSLLGISAPKKM